jgi:hypothetical protein
MVRDQVSRVDGERTAVHFLHTKFDIFEQCEPLHCQHEQRVFSRRPLAGVKSVLQGYYHDSTRRERCAPEGVPRSREIPMDSMQW